MTRLFSTFFLTICILFNSCYAKPYRKGDRLVKRGNYPEALLAYRGALEKEGLPDEYRDTLKFKTAVTFSLMEDSRKAFELVKDIDTLPNPHTCAFHNFKLSLFNKLLLQGKNRETAEVLERAENSSCKPDESILTQFYDNLLSVYDTEKKSNCHRTFLKGRLKSDTADLFAAVQYYKSALRCDPQSDHYFSSLIGAFRSLVESLGSELDPKEKRKFYSHNYPMFFAFLSEVYFKKEGIDPAIKESIKSGILDTASNFTAAKAANPIPAYSSLHFRNAGSLVKTYNINETIKVFKIDEEETLSRYIIISPEDSVIGITDPITDKNFIPLN